jgi:Ca2+-transporting ATPase
MLKPPRDPDEELSTPASVLQWAIYGGSLFLVTLAALLFGPGELNGEEPSVPMTMAFVVMSFGSILSGLALRRDPESGLTEPVLRALRTLSIPVLITIAAVELNVMQRMLSTTSLSGGQWLACIALSLVVLVVIELSKVPRRRALDEERLAPDRAVNPQRALAH